MMILSGVWCLTRYIDTQGDVTPCVSILFIKPCFSQSSNSKPVNLFPACFLLHIIYIVNFICFTFQVITTLLKHSGGFFYNSLAKQMLVYFEVPNIVNIVLFAA